MANEAFKKYKLTKSVSLYIFPEHGAQCVFYLLFLLLDIMWVMRKQLTQYLQSNWALKLAY